MVSQAFVIEQLKTNLLGLRAVTDLHLAVRMDALQTQATDIKTRFPKIFKGLGTLAGEYNIQLHPDANPHAIFRTCSPTSPIKGLDRMEKAGVISKVTEGD